MKIPVSSDDVAPSPLHRLYLVPCVAVVHVLIFIKESFPSNLAWLFVVFSKIFRPNSVVFLTLPVLVFAIYTTVSKIYLIGELEQHRAKGYEALPDYEFLEKALPSEFFGLVDFSCNKKNIKIAIKDRSVNLSTKYSLINNSDFPILLRPGARYAIHIRPRLWNAEMSKVVQEKKMISLDLGQVAFIDAHSSYSGILSITPDAFDDIDPDSRYMVVGLVQEGVRWIASRNCRFEINHEE